MKYLFIASIAALAWAVSVSVATADESHPAPVSAALSKAKADASSEPPSQSTCLTETGSRIKPPKGGCIPSASGRSYGRDEFRSTGTTNAADALRMMDPRVTSGGN